MTDVTVPEVYSEIAQELLHNYRRGPVSIAVTGPDPIASQLVGDALADALRAESRVVIRATTGLDDVEALKPQVIAPFREGGDRYLVLDGPQLLRPSLRGSWNFSVWLEGGRDLTGAALEAETAYARDADPRGAASVTLNVSDAATPIRVYSDSC